MLIEIAKRSRKAAQQFQQVSAEQKNSTLLTLTDQIIRNTDQIIHANDQDVINAHKNNLSPSMIERLSLSKNRLWEIADDLRKISQLPDPVGEIFDSTILENGLRINKQRVPIGVLAIIYESRPNVTIDVVGLSIKTSNCVILRGGSESLETNRKLISIIKQSIHENDLPTDIVQFIESTDRNLVEELLQLHEYIDMLIPRGGASLHRFCRENSKIPVISGGIGICHLYVDESADLIAAIPVIINAKTQRPTVCNALDTLLVHRSIAEQLLPELETKLIESGVSIRAHSSAKDYLSENVSLAGEGDFDKEWLSLIIGIKIVDNLDQAIEHIIHHSSGHSDGILTENPVNANRFVAEIDSAAVYVNASTRFTDGGQFGLGAEVAISTQRLHARGPMGLRELTTYKWVVHGDYHVRP